MCHGYFYSQEIDPHHATEHRSTDQSRNGCGMCCFCHAQPFEITRAKNIKNTLLQRSCQKRESCGSILLAPRPPSRSPPTYDPHSTRCTAGCHTSRDFVHWRFSDAGAAACGSPRHAGVRKPTHVRTCKVPTMICDGAMIRTPPTTRGASSWPVGRGRRIGGLPQTLQCQHSQKHFWGLCEKAGVFRYDPTNGELTEIDLRSPSEEFIGRRIGRFGTSNSHFAPGASRNSPWASFEG